MKSWQSVFAPSPSVNPLHIVHPRPPDSGQSAIGNSQSPMPLPLSPAAELLRKCGYSSGSAEEVRLDLLKLQTVAARRKSR